MVASAPCGVSCRGEPKTQAVSRLCPCCCPCQYLVRCTLVACCKLDGRPVYSNRSRCRLLRIFASESGAVFIFLSPLQQISHIWSTGSLNSCVVEKVPLFCDCFRSFSTIIALVRVSVCVCAHRHVMNKTPGILLCL